MKHNVREIIHLLNKPISSSYIIDNINVSKTKFLKYVKENNLNKHKDKNPTFGTHIIFIYS